VNLQSFVILTAFVAANLFAQTSACDLRGYTAKDGLVAKAIDGGVEITWTGEQQRQLRASFALENGRPKIKHLSVRKQGGNWVDLGHDLTPEYEITSGKRRMSEQQLQPLRKLNVPIKEALLDREKWNAFWDAPLEIPGRPGTNSDLPR
jgi:hypothetical protein